MEHSVGKASLSVQQLSHTTPFKVLYKKKQEPKIKEGKTKQRQK